MKSLPKPPPKAMLPEMKQFISLVKAKGWTMEALRDLLVAGVMAQCPPSLASVRKWVKAEAEPRAYRVAQLRTFIATHNVKKGRPK